MCEPIKNIGESGLLSDGMTEPRNAKSTYWNLQRSTWTKGTTAEIQVIKLHCTLAGIEASNPNTENFNNLG